MFVRLWALFFAVPLIELVLLIVLAHFIGWPWTIGLTLLSSLVGAELARRSGRQWWREMQALWAQGTMNPMQLSEGAVILVAAAFVLTPGPMTGVIGLLLLVPAVRRAFIRWMGRTLMNRWVRW